MPVVEAMGSFSAPLLVAVSIGLSIGLCFIGRLVSSCALSTCCRLALCFGLYRSAFALACWSGVALWLVALNRSMVVNRSMACALSISLCYIDGLCSIDSLLVKRSAVACCTVACALSIACWSSVALWLVALWLVDRSVDGC